MTLHLHVHFHLLYSFCILYNVGTVCVGKMQGIGDYRKDDGWGYSILIKEGGIMGDKVGM